MIYFRPMGDMEGMNRTPALSYPRVADSILSGILAGLMERGYTEKMASAFITSQIFVVVFIKSLLVKKRKISIDN